MAHANVPLPPPNLRPGEAANQQDDVYTRRADGDVERLIDLVGLSEDTRLLDWGCGPGRLAVGIARRFGRIRHYHGVDVNPPSIEWGARHLDGPGFEWTLVDASNARYNPNGTEAPSIPASSDSYDVVWAWSVLSHMDADDVRDYAPEIARVLARSGVAALSAFVEDDVPDVTENPDDYLGRKWSGPLHCVRFERRFFTQLLAEGGLTVQEIHRPRGTSGQSLVMASRA